MVTWEYSHHVDLSFLCETQRRHSRVFSFYDMFTDQMLFVRYVRVSFFPFLAVASV